MSIISCKDEIFNAIIYGLKQIKTSSGYNYTVRNVYDPPIELDNMIEYPSINVFEGRESCENANVGSHQQIGGNQAKLHNSFTFEMDCVLSEIENARQSRNKILADIQKYFGLHWGIPSSAGVDTSFCCFYQTSTPWGIDKMKPRTGITISYIVWYDQLLTDPTQRAR